ncbi:MAG: hypothetical protein R3E86_16270 [Pseudomonadales bacterium]
MSDPTCALVNQHIAAIRKVWWPSDGAPAQIEIETKHGRFVSFHVEPATGRVAARRGPACQPEDAAEARCWQDLTETLPFAFDGRPLIVTVAAEAGAQVVTLSSGARLSVCSDGGAILVTGD